MKYLTFVSYVIDLGSRGKNSTRFRTGEIKTFQSPPFFVSTRFWIMGKGALVTKRALEYPKSEIRTSIS
jgi:hypothetical protein